MTQPLIGFALLLLPLALGSCSNDQSGGDGSTTVASDVAVANEGADSSGSMYYIPDEKISVIAERAKKGDNEALMKIINHYYFSYVGDDKDALSEKWEKIAADRALNEPLRNQRDISEALLDKNVAMSEVNRMNLGKELRGVTVNYFHTLLKQRRDCSMLKVYAEKAKKANPECAKEITSELEAVCKK